MNPEQVEGVGEDGKDVVRCVLEHVARILVVLGSGLEASSDGVDAPIAVGVNEPTYQRSGAGFNDLVLPGLEFNSAFVLASWAMLWKHALPVFPIGIDVDASFSQGKTNLVDAADDDNVGCDHVNSLGVLEIACEPQLIQVVPGLPDPTVPLSRHQADRRKPPRR